MIWLRYMDGLFISSWDIVVSWIMGVIYGLEDLGYYWIIIIRILYILGLEWFIKN